MTRDSQVAYQAVAADVSAEPTFEPFLVGIVILRAGTLAFVNEKGDTVTRTFPAPNDGTSGEGGSYPFTLWGRVHQILDETDLADGDIICLQ